MIRASFPRKISLVAVLAAVLTCGVLVPADAKNKVRKVETFQGSCNFEGTVRFDPPLGNSSQPTQVVADATGHCSGTLTDAKSRVRQLEQSPVLFHEESQGDQSCLSNPGSTGTGFLAFEGARIDFLFHERRVGPSGQVEAEGRSGGRMSGTFTASGDPVAISMACAAGAFAQTGFSASASTEPSISG
jgi:hypothetical protein